MTSEKHRKFWNYADFGIIRNFMDEALFLRKYDNHNSLGKERDFGQAVRWRS